MHGAMTNWASVTTNCLCLALSVCPLPIWLGSVTPNRNLGAGISYAQMTGGVVGTCRNCVGGSRGGGTCSSSGVIVGVSASPGLFSYLATSTTISLIVSNNLVMSSHDCCWSFLVRSCSFQSACYSTHKIRITSDYGSIIDSRAGDGDHVACARIGTIVEAYLCVDTLSSQLVRLITQTGNY